MAELIARTRRDFLADVGRGALAATLGAGVASELGLAPARAFGANGGGDEADALTFGPLEPLVRAMQETPPERLLPSLVGLVKGGADLRQLVAAAALANARTFGGEDYVGYHTLMALAPAFHMSRELPEASRPLPVFKVLYRNTTRIQQRGGRRDEVLRAVQPAPSPPKPGGTGGEALRESVRRLDMTGAEQTFAGLAAPGRPVEEAFNDLLLEVQDAAEVHRVVLPYRAWDLLEFVGREHAHTLLRQSVRYCVRAESYAARAWGGPRELLPRLLERHGLLARPPGDRAMDDIWVAELSATIFAASPGQAAEAVAIALAEGAAPDAVGEALSLAANQLVLRDVGRTARDESAGKPIGSIHGDSIGVHASDSANAWRNMARIANPRNAFACLILGAYQVAHDRVERGGDFLKWQPLPLPDHVERVQSADAAALLRDAEEAIRDNRQARAAAVVHRYGSLGHPARAVFDLFLKYAVSEDGSLHAEKYYRTVSEEFATTRPAFRWRQLVALARVTASEFGRPAAGYAEARNLLGV